MMEFQQKSDEEIINWLSGHLMIEAEVETIQWDLQEFRNKKIEVFIRREDQIHPWIQGNKWHKLKYFLIQAFKTKKSGLVSMGGAYSNHLIAIGYAAHQLKIPCHLLIRGSEKEWDNNPAIAQLKEWDCRLNPVDRTDFRRLHQEYNPNLLLKFEDIETDYQWIPMGGSCSESVSYIADWAKKIETKTEFDTVVIPVASAGTIAGFSVGLSETKKILGVEVLKGNSYIKEEWEVLIRPYKTINQPGVEWIADYHFGGYAKSSVGLREFCKWFYVENGFHIEPVYSGKAFWAVSDLAQKGHFKEGSRILIVHTGGIFPWTFA